MQDRSVMLLWWLAARQVLLRDSGPLCEIDAIHTKARPSTLPSGALAIVYQMDPPCVSDPSTAPGQGFMSTHRGLRLRNLANPHVRPPDELPPFRILSLRACSPLPLCVTQRPADPPRRVARRRGRQGQGTDGEGMRVGRMVAAAGLLSQQGCEKTP